MGASIAMAGNPVYLVSSISPLALLTIFTLPVVVSLSSHHCGCLLLRRSDSAREVTAPIVDED